MYSSYSYESKLEEARKSGIRKGIVNGLITGVLFLVIYGGILFEQIKLPI